MTTDLNQRCQIKQTIQQLGLERGVRLLHAGSPYRFTSLYRFGGHVSCNWLCYDRENPSATTFPESIPITAPYCIFTIESGKSVEINDATLDPRLASHPDRQIIRSYIGLPLVDANGKVVGSLCHFDLRPVVPSEADRERLYEIGDYIGENLERF